MTHALLAREPIAELAAALVRIPSVNPSIAPDEAHGEAAVARFAVDWLSDRGVTAWLEEAAPGRPNAVAEVRGGDGPTIVWCAHLDTVGTAGMEAPFAPVRRDGRVYGRGSYDMKGSAAAILCAAAALAETRWGGRLLLALVADEEYASLGAQDFVRRHRADACVLTEASGLDLVLAHKGFVWARVSTRGRAAHGSRWDLGASAIARMGPVIEALTRLDEQTLRRRVDPRVGPASMHCGRVSGGVGISTYAPACTLEIERRTLPGEDVDEVVREIASVVRGADPEAEVEAFLDRPALACDPDAPIARAAREAAAAVLGRPPAERGVAYWMDAAIFAAAGIPTVNFGPEGAGAHETVEWVDERSLVALARVLAECSVRFAAS